MLYYKGSVLLKKKKEISVQLKNRALCCFQICRDMQVSRCLVCLHSSSSYSKELLCLLISSGSCWYLDFDTVLTINPLIVLHKCSFFFFFFCNLVSRHIQVCWVEPVINKLFLGYIRVDPLGMIYYVVSPFQVVPGLGLMPPSLYLFLFI